MLNEAWISTPFSLLCFCFDVLLFFVLYFHFLHHQLLKAIMKEFKVEEHFNAANSFKPWKKNFLAECLKCESMSRPTDHLSSQLEVEHNKHLIWLSIMIVKWTLFIDLIMGIINIQSKKELVNALQLCFLHRRSVVWHHSRKSGNFSHPRNVWKLRQD